MGLVDTTTFVYQFIFDENDSDNTKIIQYSDIHGLGLCIKLDNYVSHMFYSWSFSHNTEVPFAIKKNKYYPSLNTCPNLFSWRALNSNKNIT